MAHKKAGGSSRNGRDSESKRLGTKVYGGESIRAGASTRAPSVVPRSRPSNRHAVAALVTTITAIHARATIRC